MFKYATDANLLHLMTHLHGRVKEWTAEWNLTLEQERELLQIHALALQQSGQAVEALRVIVTYLNTFKSENNLAPEILTLMRAALIYAINSPVDAFKDRCALLEVFLIQVTY